MRSLIQSDGHRRRQKEPSARPAWARMLSILCVLLLSVVSTAQACHAHPDRVSVIKRSHGSGTPGSLPGNTPGPDHCPICVAMHSALPSAQGAVPTPIFTVQSPVTGSASSRRLRRVAFAMFCRPPPAPDTQTGAAGAKAEL